MAKDSAFSGIRVVDFTQGIAGPYATMLLAEQGADVIKVEPPAGDRTRGKPAFHVLNRSKRGVVLDLSRDEGRAKALELAAGADVVLADALPAELQRLGIDYAAVSRRNPGVVYCNVPLFGSQGPNAELPPNDDLLAASSGLLGLQWSYRGAPVYLVAPIASYAAGILAAGVVSATLFDRSRTGQGDYIELSGLSGAFALQTTTYIVPLGAIDIIRLAGGHGDPKGPFPTYRVYQAADGEWLLLAALTPVFWMKLVLALDLAEWLADPRYVGAPVAIPVDEDRKEIADRLQGIFASQPRQYWLDFLRENDVPCGPVASRDDYLDGELVALNGMRVEIDDPEVGKTVQMGVPVSLAEMPGAVRGPAPLLGQHNQEILSQPLPAAAAVAKGDAPAGKGPLDGITVLDLGTIYAGPYASMILSDLGANVIKVEPLDGDPWRAFAFGFLGVNRGKRGLSLDLKSSEGLALFYDLVRKADVVSDNFRTGVLKRLKVDYETLSAVNPRIICNSMTPFGTSGPMAGQPGFDPILQARSGLMRAQGGEGEEPVFYQIAVSDFTAALVAAYGLMGAIYARERTGLGQLVETTLAGAAMVAQAAEFVRYQGRPAGIKGRPDLIGLSALYRSYQCSDGWVFLAVATQSEAEALLSLTKGVPSADAASLLQAPAEGKEASQLEPFFAALTKAEAVSRLNGKGVPCAPCLRMNDLFDDEHLKANDFWWETEHPVNGPVRQTGRTIKWKRHSMVMERPGPVLGQHSREVLLELGIEPARVEDLIGKGVVMAAELPEVPVWKQMAGEG